MHDQETKNKNKNKNSNLRNQRDRERGGEKNNVHCHKNISQIS